MSRIIIPGRSGLYLPADSGGIGAAHAHTGGADGDQIDHGNLLGLADDDHTQYHTDARALTWLGTRSIADIGTRDHDLLTGLTDDDHSQYLNNARHDIDARHSAINHHALAGLADDDHGLYMLDSAFVWTGFTPTLTATVTNPTLGTGGVAQGQYMQAGELVVYRFYFQFGTSGSNPGSGTYEVDVPVNISSDTPANTASTIGHATLFDWSVAGHKELGTVSRNSATTIRLFVDNATVSHNNPFTWADDDRFGGTVVYQSV